MSGCDIQTSSSGAEDGFGVFGNRRPAAWQSSQLDPPDHTAQANSIFGRIAPMKIFRNAVELSLFLSLRRMPMRRAQSVYLADVIVPSQFFNNSYTKMAVSSYFGKTNCRPCLPYCPLL